MRKKVGWVLLLFACVCWLFIIIIPFITDGLGRIAVLITAAVVLGEMLFWIGSFLVGKEVLTHFKQKWLSKSKRSNEID